MEKLPEEEALNLPKRYAEIDRIEEEIAKIIFFKPSKTEKVRVFPTVTKVGVVRYDKKELPEERSELDRFQVKPEGEGDFTVEKGKKTIDIQYDEELTDKVTKLVHTVM